MSDEIGWTIFTNPKNLYEFLQDLSLTTGLSTCLDVGDSSSYNRNSLNQYWIDLTGNANSFFVGDNLSPRGRIPTFNGVPDRNSRYEFFEATGQSVCASLPTKTWYKGLHKNNAVFTLLSIIQFVPNTALQTIFSTSRASPDQGINFNISGSEIPTLNVYDDVGSNVLTVSTGIVLPTNWCVCSVSLDEAAGTGRFVVDQTEYTFTSTYGTPSATDSTAVPGIGGPAPFSSGSLMANTSKIAAFAAWNTTALSTAQLQSIHSAVRAKYGI